MDIEIESARVRRVLLADGWHAVEDIESGSSFQLGALRLSSGGQPSAGGTDDVGIGFSFVDHHTRKRLAGPVNAIRGLELDQ